MSANTITPKQLAELASAGTTIELIDVRTPVEFREIHVGFARNVPLDQFDAAKIQRWSSAVTAQIGRMQSREQMIENAQQICELQNFVIASMREREAQPREDMISDLVHAQLVEELAGVDVGG